MKANNFHRLANKIEPNAIARVNRPRKLVWAGETPLTTRFVSALDLCLISFSNYKINSDLDAWKTSTTLSSGQRNVACRCKKLFKVTMFYKFYVSKFQKKICKKLKRILIFAKFKLFKRESSIQIQLKNYSPVFLIESVKNKRKCREIDFMQFCANFVQRIDRISVVSISVVSKFFIFYILLPC